jgi:hypothetical protein
MVLNEQLGKVIEDKDAPQELKDSAQKTLDLYKEWVNAS